VLHKVRSKRLLGVWCACAKLRKRLREERVYDVCHLNTSATYIMYIISAGFRMLTRQQGQTCPNCTGIILSDNYSHVLPLFRRKCERSVDWTRWVRKMRQHDLTNDVCHINCGLCSRRSQSDALKLHVVTEDRQYLYLPVTGRSLSKVLPAFPCWLADTSRRWP
jgi:hypothetical protein